jgi:hypothetical protein
MVGMVGMVGMLGMVGMVGTVVGTVQGDPRLGSFEQARGCSTDAETHRLRLVRPKIEPFSAAEVDVQSTKMRLPRFSNKEFTFYFYQTHLGDPLWWYLAWSGGRYKAMKTYL